jgi:hypothetical protein
MSNLQRLSWNGDARGIVRTRIQIMLGRLKEDDRFLQRRRDLYLQYLRISQNHLPHIDLTPRWGHENGRLIRPELQATVTTNLKSKGTEVCHGRRPLQTLLPIERRSDEETRTHLTDHLSQTPSMKTDVLPESEAFEGDFST